MNAGSAAIVDYSGSERGRPFRTQNFFCPWRPVHFAITKRSLRVGETCIQRFAQIKRTPPTEPTIMVSMAVGAAPMMFSRDALS